MKALYGNATTRWSSNATDNEWLTVDLGSTHTIGRVILSWETAAGRVFDLQVSNDNATWTTLYRELHGPGGKQDIPLYGSGRYVRMKGLARATSFGYSLYELEIYDYITGQPQTTYTIPALPTPTTVAAGQGGYLTNDITISRWGTPSSPCP